MKNNLSQFPVLQMRKGAFSGMIVCIVNSMKQITQLREGGDYDPFFSSLNFSNTILVISLRIFDPFLGIKVVGRPSFFDFLITTLRAVAGQSE